MTPSQPSDRSVAPEVHSFGPLALQEAWKERLDNGLTIHVMRGDSTDVCRFAIAVPGGEAHNSLLTPMSVASQLLLEGTPRLSGEVIASSLEDRGAWCGTGVSTHFTTFTVSCLSEHLMSLLPLTREVVFSPAFAPDAVGKVLERLAAQNEVERCKVTWQASAAGRKALYGETHPMAFAPTPAEILSITPDTLRAAHYSRLDVSGMHIFISGGVTQEMVEAVKREFGSIRTDVSFPIVPLAFPHHEHGRETFVEMPDALQSSVIVAIPAAGRDESDFVPLRMAVIALGGYFGSRLMLNIREEKGLTYGISAVLPAFREQSFVTVSTQCDCANTAEVRTEIFREIEKMKDPSSYTPDEVSRLSRYILSGLASVLDTPISRMDFLQSVFMAGARPGYFAEQERVARALTPELLASMAEKYFNPDLAFITVAGRN